MENNRLVTSVPQEKTAPHRSGFFGLLVNIVGMIAAICCIILGCIRLENNFYLYGGILLGVGLVGITAFSILLAGLKVLAPNQAYVFTLFGRYYGTLKTPGFFYLNPFVTANAPTVMNGEPVESVKTAANGASVTIRRSKKISLKTRTLVNRTQKVNDAMGNPIIIGSVVIWRVADPTAAVFAVENFEDYLSTQCDSTIRNIARLYPYDSMGDDPDEKTLRGSSSEVSEIMQQELAERVKDAGIVIEDVRITTLAYSDEIAAAMLQRQQATAIIAARQKIVEGAVGMVKMAIDQLSEEEVVVLDEERKAAMVSNLLVVLCGSKDAQPIVNSGSIY
ncbi:MAG: SPFH domain-containing protein [Clostridiales bacterium]|nr:SPFH domain-containing protein [Clostridiales bacterium]